MTGWNRVSDIGGILSCVESADTMATMTFPDMGQTDCPFQSSWQLWHDENHASFHDRADL